MPLLVKAGLAHVQFETIHPFLDGNGRLGRLLISLLLFNEGVLQQPILYLSLYLKQQRDEYYRLLQAVRTEGTWEEWLEFFIDGIRQTADQCVQTARSLAAMFQRDRDKIQRLGKAAGSALRVYEVLKRRPIVSIGKAAADANLSIPTVAKSLGHLETMGIVRETTQKSRGRRYVYGDYIALLNEGTEPRKQGAGSRER
jgi:Fic family protein